jgi:hypothetical protein
MATRTQTRKKKSAPQPDSPLRYGSGLASPFIAGTPPASSSGRGRGSIITSLFCSSKALLRFCVHGGVAVPVSFLWVGEEVPPAYPPASGRRNLSNPLEGEGRWGVCVSVCCLRAPPPPFSARGGWRCFFYYQRPEGVLYLYPVYTICV